MNLHSFNGLSNFLSYIELHMQTGIESNLETDRNFLNDRHLYLDRKDSIFVPLLKRIGTDNKV